MYGIKTRIGNILIYVLKPKSPKINKISIVELGSFP
jgi:hypothetical protein